MYKILTKLHTHRDGIHVFHMIQDENKQWIEYATDSQEEAKEMALSLLKKVGYKDLRIVDDKDYYVEIDNVANELITSKEIEQAEDLLQCVGYGDLYLSNDAQYDVQLYWGKKPEEEKPVYTITVQAPEGFIVVPYTSTVTQGDSATFTIGFTTQIQNFHFKINGQDFPEGIPSYIKYDKGVVTIENVQSDLAIELIQN